MFRNVAMNLMIESIHEMRQEIYRYLDMMQNLSVYTSIEMMNINGK